MAWETVAIGVGAVTAVALVYFFLFAGTKAPTTLSPQKKVPLELVEREDLSHNVRRFRFALPSKEHILGLPVGKHVFVSTKLEGKLVSRAYSPVSPTTAKGFCDLVFKVYYPDEEKKIPGGVLTCHLDSLKVGQSVDFRGPMGKYEYVGGGALSVKVDGQLKTKKVKNIGMIAGGTGITPMLAIIRQVFSDPGDTTHVSMIFANNTEEDIFLREELEKYAEEQPNFHLHYTLAHAPKGWAYSTGFLDQAMIEEHLPVAAGDDSAILICGPPPMIKFAVTPALEKIGYPRGSVFVW